MDHSIPLLTCLQLLPTVHTLKSGLFVKASKALDLALSPCSFISHGLPHSPIAQPCSMHGSLIRVRPFIPLQLGIGLFSLLEIHLFLFLPFLCTELSPGKPVLMPFSACATQTMLSSPSTAPENLITCLPLYYNDCFHVYFTNQTVQDQNLVLLYVHSLNI